jgi:hypothetical protein
MTKEQMEALIERWTHMDEDEIRQAARQLPVEDRRDLFEVAMVLEEKWLQVWLREQYLDTPYDTLFGVFEDLHGNELENAKWRNAT